MLQSDLLLVWKRKGELIPRYAKLSEKNLEASQSLIEAYRAHIGEKKKDLKTLVTELESKGFEYRFIRGLSSLLDRKSTFTCNCKVRPSRATTKNFSNHSNKGFANNCKETQRNHRSSWF